jgi:hypothetical protein
LFEKLGIPILLDVYDCKELTDVMLPWHHKQAASKRKGRGAGKKVKFTSGSKGKSGAVSSRDKNGQSARKKRRIAKESEEEEEAGGNHADECVRE